MSESKNRPLLRSFTSYCIDHPEQRFWQALRNWSGQHFILAAINMGGVPERTVDTFYWEHRDG